MTKSSRRMDPIAGRSKWSTTDKKCEECNGNTVKVGVNVYVCTKCGLKQRSKVKRKSPKSDSFPKYSQQIEKQWEKKYFTPPILMIDLKITNLKISNIIKPNLLTEI